MKEERNFLKGENKKFYPNLSQGLTITLGIR
jgi:hypothetical protein